MTSPNSNILSEDFDLNLKPIQNSLLEKFRSYLGQNLPNENQDNRVDHPTSEINNFSKTKKNSSTALVKFKKDIFDEDITIAEMIEKKSKLPTKKAERKKKNENLEKNNEIDENEQEKNNENNDSKLKKKNNVISKEKNEKITCLSFRKHAKVSKWTEDETRTFYNGIQRYGTDFSMIATLLPDKTRLQIKNKYQKELRENPQKIEKNMRNPKPISKNVGDKLIELDKHINKSQEFQKDKSGNEENGFHISDIPEINLEDLNVLKNNSIISNESLDKNINEQIFNIIQKETEILKQQKTFKSFNL